MSEKDFSSILKKFSEPVTLVKEGVGEFSFGRLQFSIQKFYREFHLDWWYASESLDFSAPAQRPPEDRGVGSLKWVTEKDSELFTLTPALPDKPMVLKSNQSLKIPAGINADFFILIPLFLQVKRPGPKGTLIFEKSDTPVFNSWFGDMATGEMGYHQPSSFYQELKNLPSKYDMAICPLTVKNESESDLVFDKLLLQCQYLTLFSGSDNFWTNGVDVTYENGDGQSKIKFKKAPPQKAGITRKFSDPREEGDKNLVINTFEIIKKFTGF